MRIDLRWFVHALPLLVSSPGLTLPAQTLKLSAAEAARGARAAIEISLKAPKGKAPVALQWETVLPASDLSLIDNDVAIGPAAQQAGKSIACANKQKTGRTVTSLCILAGGREPIQNGVVARFKLTASENARIGRARIRVERGIAVSIDATEVPMPPVETSVSIHAK
jgi:hypothetical protein